MGQQQILATAAPMLTNWKAVFTEKLKSGSVVGQGITF